MAVSLFRYFEEGRKNMTWLWFVVGAVVGATVGIVMMCCVQVAAQSDRNRE